MKTILIAAVALVVGISAGIGAGYALFAPHYTAPPPHAQPILNDDIYDLA